jgi:hypothetical protein
MQRDSWMQGKKRKKTKRTPSEEEVLEEVEAHLIEDENKVQQKTFEQRIKWAMED